MFTLEVPLEQVTSINHIPGWCDGRMMERLQELGRGCETIVNIGAWKGRSCAALAQECAGVVWAIDHWRGSPQEVDGTISKDHKQAADNPLSLYWEFCQYMNHFGLLGTRIIPITGDSLKVAKLFKAKTVDLVFVDGGHDFQSVWNDLTTWAGMVRPGSILCGDDYGWDGVRQAVDAFHEQYKGIHRLGDLEIELDGKFWVMRRGE